MDPLSITASIIAVLQATYTVINTCYGYWPAVKGELQRIIDGVISLRDVLESLMVLAKRAESSDPAAHGRLPTLELLCKRPTGLLIICLDQLKALEKKLAPSSRSDHGWSKKKSDVIDALKWSLKKDGTVKLLENIERSKATLNLALTGDQAASVLAIEDTTRANQIGIQDVQKSISEIRTDDQRRNISQWLSAPNPQSNYDQALKQRQTDTGTWFINGKDFADWKKMPNSFIWVHGIPGCGKSILCASITENLFHYCRLNPDVMITLFFCFDFNDNEKQRHENMLRSLLTQLLWHIDRPPDALKSLYISCRKEKSQLTPDLMLTVLRQIIENLDEVFLVLDALDECTERSKLLTDIETVAGWNIPNLHMLATSRKEIDIEESMDNLCLKVPVREICIQSQLVDHDVRSYIQEQLRTSPKLKRWRNNTNMQREIETSLMEKVDGMFRWAVCQLDALEHCFSPEMLREALTSLPETLDKTYDRIIDGINQVHGRMALRVLQWLVFSAQPMTLEEINEVIAIDVEKTPRFTPDRRFQEPRDILKMCSSLVSLVPLGDAAYSQKWRNIFGGSSREENDARNSASRFEVRLSHYSVKEYLVSDRSRGGSAERYSIQEVDANRSIAETCLAYLLHFVNLADSNNLDNLIKLERIDSGNFRKSYQGFREFPLLEYTIKRWGSHARIFEENTVETSPLAMELFVAESHTWVKWSHVFEYLQRGTTAASLRRNNSKKLLPLIEASKTGLPNLVKALLDSKANVDALGGEAENQLLIGALLGASDYGRHHVVQLLLNHGIDFNTREEQLGEILSTSLCRRHFKVVQVLLTNEDYVNAHRGFFSKALRAAAREGHEEIIKLLLNQGADINARSNHGWIPLALHEAAGSGREKVVKLLLNEGADVNLQARDGGESALQAAITILCHEPTTLRILKLLLDGGADVNAGGGHCVSALQKAALFEMSEEIMQLLLDKGANVNAQRVDCGTALTSAASSRRVGSERIVQLLLSHGADVNAQGRGGSALQTAAAFNSEGTAQLLLNHGADVNAQGGTCRPALLNAADRGRAKMMILLLNHGADPYAQGGIAMELALGQKSNEAVKVLLDVARVNSRERLAGGSSGILEDPTDDLVTKDDILAYWERNIPNRFRDRSDGT